MVWQMVYRPRVVDLSAVKNFQRVALFHRAIIFGPAIVLVPSGTFTLCLLSPYPIGPMWFDVGIIFDPNEQSEFVQSGVGPNGVFDYYLIKY